MKNNRQQQQTYSKLKLALEIKPNVGRVALGDR